MCYFVGNSGDEEGRWLVVEMADNSEYLGVLTGHARKTHTVLFFLSSPTCQLFPVITGTGLNMRGFRMSIVSLILWGWLLQSVAARKEKRNAIPKFTFDPATPKSCAWWLDVDGPWTCEGIEQVFEVSPVDFLRWVCRRTSGSSR